MKSASISNKIPLAIIQLATKRCMLEYNYNIACNAIRKAAVKGARIICSQECMLDGYAFDRPEFQKEPEKYCVTLDSTYCRGFQALAQELQVYLVIGLSLLQSPGVYRNAVLLIDSEGKIAGQYYKVHSTYGNVEAKFYRHGEDFPIFAVTIDGRKITIGIMICYDRQMPECARILAIRGAEIIFNPAATGNFWQGWNTRLIQTRARENRCFIVSVNHAWPRINGRSFVVNPNGTILCRCPPWSSVKIIGVDLEKFRKKRKDLQTRRPSIYKGLLEPFA